MKKNCHGNEEKVFREKIQEDIRPWGKFRSYPYELAKNIKIITVKPGAALSLQFHLHRSEFWVVLDNGLEMTLGDKVWKPLQGEEIFIPQNVPHRLRNVSPNPVRVMEIWIGDSTEEDVIRIRDDYGREKI